MKLAKAIKIIETSLEKAVDTYDCSDEKEARAMRRLLKAAKANLSLKDVIKTQKTYAEMFDKKIDLEEE